MGQTEDSHIILAVHGGAGTITQENLTPEREAAYLEGLKQALNAGLAILKNGGSALDAVEAAVTVLEDNPLFNAGKGSVFTRAGTHEMDASIMDGRTLQAGAVAGVKTIKNPIKAARVVMERTPHVMLIGDGADAFAREQGLQTADPAYFFDEYRYRQYQQTQPLKQPLLDHSDDKGQLPQSENADEYGTVGAVALDRYGNLAAATSTGGMTNKLPGRIGDTPIIGAGTYANNYTCAVSCTGHGEYFIRTVAAHMVSDLMQYRHYSPEEAVHTVLDSITTLGAGGGIIALDKQGRLTMQFTTTAMLRGFVTQDGKTKVYIFKPD